MTLKYKNEYSFYFAFLCGIIALPLLFQSFYNDVAFLNNPSIDLFAKQWALHKFNYLHGLWLIPSALMLLFLIDYLNPKLLLKLDLLGYIYIHIRKVYKHVTVALKRKKIE